MLRVKREDLEYWYNDAGGTPTYRYNGEPFTGILLIYEDEGWLSVEEEYQNGFKEGWQRDYYQNGNLEEEYRESNNVMIRGTYKRFDENGNQIIGN